MNQLPPKPFSKIGIISFFFSILSPIAFLSIFLLGVFGGKFGIDAAFISFWVSCGSAVSAFILGIAAFFQRRTKRIFGVLGFTFGLLEIIGIFLSVFVLIKFLEVLGKALGSGFGKM